MHVKVNVIIYPYYNVQVNRKVKGLERIFYWSTKLQNKLFLIILKCDESKSISFFEVYGLLSINLSIYQSINLSIYQSIRRLMKSKAELPNNVILVMH